MDGPAIPAHHRARRSAIVQGFAGWFLKTSGWRIRGELPAAHKLILAVGPHTSNWDFIVCVAAMLALDIRIYWLGKHSIFRWPVAKLMCRLGGIAVDRSNTLGVAEQIGGRLRAADEMILAITPEGTRRKVAKLKTGFARIARAGQCPIVPLTLDFALREIRLHPLFEASDDPEADALSMRTIFATATPRRPQGF